MDSPTDAAQLIPLSPMSANRAAIFDFDGTIANSFNELARFTTRWRSNLDSGG